jgi:hypothetical protein
MAVAVAGALHCAWWPLRGHGAAWADTCTNANMPRRVSKAAAIFSPWLVPQSGRRTNHNLGACTQAIPEPSSKQITNFAVGRYYYKHCCVWKNEQGPCNLPKRARMVVERVNFKGMPCHPLLPVMPPARQLFCHPSGRGGWGRWKHSPLPPLRRILESILMLTTAMMTTTMGTP